jgi:dTDP-4-amino-4,6-dideoxygalactose transaminase
LPHLDAWNEARRARAALYRELLPAELRPVEERPESPSVHHLFPVRHAGRQRLAESLQSAGVETGVHYSPACHRQPPFAAAQVPARDPFPVASAWGAEELSLPMFEHLTDPEVERVAEACRTALARIAA